MKKYKYFKKITLVGLLVIGLLFAGCYIRDNNYIFLYTNPNNNTEIYPYISKASEEINEILFKSAKLLRVNIPDTKILYTNGYGSGFLKNNHTPSDYDYSAGLYIGKYNYDGNNTDAIAEKLLQTIALYQASIYSLVKRDQINFYIQKMPSERIYGINSSKETDAELMSNSLKQALKEKPYNLLVGEEVFILQPNEIVLPNYNFIKLYNKDISYFQGYRKMLRELTVTIDYYCDIIDTRTNKTYPISLVAAVGNQGLRLYQPDFKYFVPNAFTSWGSYKYVKNIMPQLDGEKYFNTRLLNYFLHYSLLSYGNSRLNSSPLKPVKRLLQCTDIIAPILPKEITAEIHSSVYNIINNQTISEINDYYVANEILYNITKARSFYEELEKNNEVTNHIINMESILKDMINDPQLSYDELKPLFEYHKAVSHSKNNIQDLQNVLHEQYWPTTQYINKLMLAKMPNNKKLNEYINYLNKVLEVGGIYNLKFYKDRPNHIFIFKDNFTDKLKLNDLQALDISNGYYTRIYNNNTEFEFKDPKDFYGDTKDLSYGWVRYNPTKMQDAIYKEMLKYFEKDRHNYHLRIRAGIQR